MIFFPKSYNPSLIIKKKKKLDKFQLSKRLQNLNSTPQSSQGLEDYRKTDTDWRRIKAIWWLMEHGSLDLTLEQEKKVLEKLVKSKLNLHFDK